MTPLTVLRYYGNAQVLVGHFVLLYVSMFWGLVLCFTANLLLMPWAVKYKFWDVVIILGFFGVIEGSKLMSLVFSG